MKKWEAAKAELDGALREEADAWVPCTAKFILPDGEFPRPPTKAERDRLKCARARVELAKAGVCAAAALL